MKAISIAAVSFIALSAGSAFASPSTVNAVFEAPRIFNDFTTSSLTITNNFAASVRIQESGYADDSVGGNFANKHAFWYSDNGGVSPLDYNYGDGFYFSVTVTDSSTGIGGSEVGMNSDLFGFGFFGSGIGPGGSEIAAFGGTLPFHSFGSGLYTQGDALGLAMIYRPGPAEFGLPAGTIEYRYQINGGGWVSSGQIVFTNTEGGFPSGGFNQFFGFGAQFNNPIGGTADVLFENIVAVPAPGAAALLGLGGLVVSRRRR